MDQIFLCILLGVLDGVGISAIIGVYLKVTRKLRNAKIQDGKAQLAKFGLNFIMIFGIFIANRVSHAQLKSLNLPEQNNLSLFLTLPFIVCGVVGYFIAAKMELDWRKKNQADIRA